MAADHGDVRSAEELFDEASSWWTDLFGVHMHHGFYDAGALSTHADHRAAGARMIEEALRFAGVSDDAGKRPKRIVDVGCGVGGSSIYLANKYKAQVQGFALGKTQVQKANSLAAAEGLGGKVSFQIADALEQPFPDGQFDLVWSIESAEYMPDKTKFMSELLRVAAPGGTIIIVTVCHRDLSANEKSLPHDEIEFLEKLRHGSCLPPYFSSSGYVKIAKSLEFEDIKVADWSHNVAPFWPGIIQSVLSEEGMAFIIPSGAKTIEGAQVMPLMMEGYCAKLLKYSVITCRKPE